MLRKRILLVLILGIVAWIITDLYKVIDLMQDGRYKIDFLESISVSYTHLTLPTIYSV